MSDLQASSPLALNSQVSFVTHDDEMLRRVRIAGWRRTQKEAGYTGWEPVDRDMDEAKMFQVSWSAKGA